jgi:formylmethanofuran--tetrahydromethanopterin N-formyltransferase
MSDVAPVLSPGGPIVINGVFIEPEFAEAFDMKATRLILTAHDRFWVDQGAAALVGFGTSVIACGLEIAVEQTLGPDQSPDGRPGVSILAFAMSGKELERQIPIRLGQCVLTCPTAAVFAGLDEVGGNRVAIGKSIRFFGDGHQISKKTLSSKTGQTKHYWRIPVMDGEFVCQHDVARISGIGGGNFLLLGTTLEAVLTATRAAFEAMRELPGIITPFPGGAARSGSKVGSKYAKLFASTNDAFCPTLRGIVPTLLADDENAALEIVIDGLTAHDVAHSMKVGITAAAQAVGSAGGLMRITAGNYGGKLGRHHFHLHEVMK